MKYSEGFRNLVLRKVLPPNEQSVYAIAKEFGISHITINNWLSKLKEGNLQFQDDGLEPRPGERSLKEKYRILLESKSVDKENPMFVNIDVMPCEFLFISFMPPCSGRPFARRELFWGLAQNAPDECLLPDREYVGES